MSDNNSLYYKYLNEFNTKYKNQYNKYPYAMVLFDNILRNMERSNDTLAKKNIKNLKLELGVKNKLKRNLKFIVTFIGSIYNLLFNKKRKNIYISLPEEKFDLLKKRIKNIKYTSDYGVKVHSSKHISEITDFILPNIKIFPPKLKKYIYNLEVENINLFINSEDYMASLDYEIKQVVSDVSNILSKSKIKFVLLFDDQQFQHRIVCEAAKLANIPCYIICHGYPHGGKYIGVLPLYGDKLLVWNEDQKDQLPDNYKSNIIVFGYPKYDRKYLNDMKLTKEKNLVTFVSQPFEETGEMFIDRTLIYDFLKNYEDLGYKIQVRLHPKEKENKNKINKIKEYGFYISEDTLLNDIYTSKYILGYNSSVLYEAFILRQNAQQIYDGITNLNFRYNMIPYVYLWSEKLNSSTTNLKNEYENKYFLNDLEDRVKQIIDERIDSK